MRKREKGRFKAECEIGTGSDKMKQAKIGRWIRDNVFLPHPNLGQSLASSKPISLFRPNGWSLIRSHDLAPEADLKTSYLHRRPPRRNWENSTLVVATTVDVLVREKIIASARRKRGLDWLQSMESMEFSNKTH
ncbi:unnamed protein product [Protopolystoma xenopodis]|uniref:Uncharacterized protein n=1 Tax=Protopolystoma xenopodis TaxID=117903 RepID=A0A3S5CJA4_9PLAT|nr:unnamed protein product [Protopolystoma xenopodis]